MEVQRLDDILPGAWRCLWRVLYSQPRTVGQGVISSCPFWNPHCYALPLVWHLSATGTLARRPQALTMPLQTFLGAYLGFKKPPLDAVCHCHASVVYVSLIYPPARSNQPAPTSNSPPELLHTTRPCNPDGRHPTLRLHLHPTLLHSQ